MALSTSAHGQCGYVVSCDYKVVNRLSSKDRAHLQIGRKGGKGVLALYITRYSSELWDAEKNVKVLEMSRAGAVAGGGNIQVWLGNERTDVAINGKLVGSTAAYKFDARPEVSFTESNAIKPKGQCRVQKLAAVEFSDDFARVEDSADDTQWEVQSGAFEVNMSRNPGSSQSAFQLWASSPDGDGMALAKVSRWFWKDLRIGTSVLFGEDDGQVGIVFNWIDAKNYHILKTGCKATSLLRVRHGKEQLLGDAQVGVNRNSWTRVDVMALCGRVSVLVGGIKLFECHDDEIVCGRVGLYLGKTSLAYFDDVMVRNSTESDFAEQPPEPFGPCEQQWSDFSGKNFIMDEYMAQWAHPRCMWHAVKDGVFVFRNRMFHDVALEWRLKRGQKLNQEPTMWIFTGEDCQGGYVFSISGGVLKLTKNGEAMKEVGLGEIKALEHFKAGTDGGRIYCEVNGNAVLEVQDDAPLTSGFVAASLGGTHGVDRYSLHRPDWRDSALVMSAHRLDYSFENAPSAWRAEAGRWQGTHRWACVPMWSFFGGRGDNDAVECSNGNAVLWNLRRISGDFDLELFAAPMEGTPMRAHFAYPVTINVAFGTDGENLGSGYNLVYGTYDTPSRLLLGSKELARDASRVEPDLRLLDTEWYRRMTQTWQHIRIQRRDGKIIVDAATHDNVATYLGLKRVFEHEDVQARKDGQFALWTNGENGLAIARATLSFQESSGAAPGIRPLERVTALKGKKGEPEQYLRRTNTVSGGAFNHVLVDKPLDIVGDQVMEFDWRPSENTRLSLMLSILDQTAEIPLDGKPVHRDYVLACPPAEVKDIGNGWKHVTARFGQHLRHVLGGGKSLVVERVEIASPYATVEEYGGIGVNARGAYYDIGDVSISTAAPQGQTHSWLPSFRGVAFANDFEDCIGPMRRFGGYDGLALSLDEDRPSNGSYSLKLYNQHVCGTAGVSLMKGRFTCAQFPMLKMKMRRPHGIETAFVFVTDKGRFEYLLTKGADVSWHEVGSMDVPDNNEWTDVSVDISKCIPADAVISEILLADAQKMGSYQRLAFHIDEFRLVPALADGQEIELAGDNIAAFAIGDGGAFTDGAKCRPADGLEPGLHEIRLRPRYADGTVGTPMALPFLKVAAAVAELPPVTAPEALLAPYVSYIPQDRMERVGLDVKDGEPERLATYGDMRIRREAWLDRDADDYATGNGCARIWNLHVNGFCSYYFKQGKWSPRRWPCFSFDYKFKRPGCMLNFSLLVNDIMTIVEWTGPNGYGNYFWNSIVGKSEYAIQDGKWHHVEVNLLEMLANTRFKDGLPADLIASELGTWATVHNSGGYINPIDTDILIDNFTLYSNHGDSPSFQWAMPVDSVAADGYSFVLDQQEGTVPPEEIMSTETEKAFSGVKPGTWFFHLRAHGKNGAWTGAVHKKIVLE